MENEYQFSCLYVDKKEVRDWTPLPTGGLVEVLAEAAKICNSITGRDDTKYCAWFKTCVHPAGDQVSFEWESDKRSVLLIIVTRTAAIGQLTENSWEKNDTSALEKCLARGERAQAGFTG